MTPRVHNDHRNYGTQYEQNGTSSTYKNHNGHVNNFVPDGFTADLVRALRLDANNLPSIDQGMVVGIADELEHSPVEDSRMREILDWLRERIGGSYAQGAGAALWTATATLLS